MWKEAYLSNVLSADPMELVCLLYQQAETAVQDARRHLKSGDIAGRGQAISKAIGCIGELNASLDPQSGPEIAANLEKLYSYMLFRLTEANIRREDGPLAEVEKLLATLGQAWREARAKQVAEHRNEVPAPAAPIWQEQVLEPVAHGWSA